MNQRNLGGWMTRQHMERAFAARERDLAGPRRDIKPMTPELRNRLNDRFEKRMARELAGDDVI